MLFFIVIILYKFINRKKKSVVNKNILITGAANGLGREIVIQV